MAKLNEHDKQRFSAIEIRPVSKPSEGFRIYKEFNSGGRIEIMDGYTGKSDHKDLIRIARDFAEQGKTVQITGNPHFKSEEYRRVFGALDGTAYERKCPDFIIDGVFYEYESYQPPFKMRKVSNMISHGAKQSSRIIINNNKGCSDRYILINIHNRLRDKSFKNNIDEIWVYEKGKVRLLYKNR
jgi:hypothetical protein